MDPYHAISLDHINLVGGSSTSHKYSKNMSQIGSFPSIGMKIRKSLKPPPSNFENASNVYPPAIFVISSLS